MKERREAARASWRARRTRVRPGADGRDESGEARSDVPQPDGDLDAACRGAWERAARAGEPGEVTEITADGYLPLERGLSRQAADELSLVLQARGVPHAVRAGGRGWSLLAPCSAYVRAQGELAAFAAENREGIGDLRPLPATRLDLAAVTLCLGLLIPFHLVTRMVLPDLGLYPHTWERAGLADAVLIRAGAWERAATALTLHADGAHLIGNVGIGAFFGAVLCTQLGLGTGMLCMVLSGVLGNLLNAFAHGGEHLSLGFSTAVFGAAGAIAGLRALSGPFSGLRGGIVPLGAGLGLLAMFGAEGERTDLGAHIFGFIAGLGLGLLAARLMRRHGPPGRLCGALAGLAALAIPVLAWIVALG